MELNPDQSHPQANLGRKEYKAQKGGNYIFENTFEIMYEIVKKYKLEGDRID